MDKVLIVGSDFFNYQYSIEQAYKNLGFETRVIAYFGGAVEGLGERIVYNLTLNKEGYLEKKKKTYNQSVLKLFNEFKPDLLFIVSGSDLYKETVEKMQGCKKKVLWMYDSIFWNKGGFNLRHSVDYIFVFENSDIPRLWDTEKIKAYFLPSALDEKVYYPTQKTTEIDLLFIGNLFKERFEMLEKVCEEFKDLNIKIYGHYYSPFRRPFYHLFRKNKHIFLNRNVEPAFTNELYNKTRICLNIHRKQNLHGVNQRFFEVCGSKAFQLTDTNGYIKENFTDNEIMTYTSIPDLFSKIRKVLSNEIETKNMVENAYQKVISNHTFTHRMKFVLNVIKWNQTSG